MQKLNMVSDINPNELYDGNRYAKPLTIMSAVLASFLVFSLCFSTTFQFLTPKFTKMFELKPIPPAEKLETVRALSYAGTNIWDQSVLEDCVEARMLSLKDYYTDDKHPDHALYYDTKTKSIQCFTEMVQKIMIPAGLMKSADTIKIVEYAQETEKTIVEILPKKGDRVAYYIDFSKGSYKKLPNNFSAATFVTVDHKYNKFVTITARKDKKEYKNVLVTDIATGEVTNVTMSGSEFLYNTAGLVTVSTDNRFINITIADPKNPETGKKQQVLYDLTDKTHHTIYGSVIKYGANDRYVIFTNNADQKVRVYDTTKKTLLKAGKWPRLGEHAYYRFEESGKILYRIDLKTGLKEAISDREVAAYKVSAKGEFIYFYLSDLKQLFSVDIGTLALKELKLPKEFLTEVKKIPQTKLVEFNLFTEITGNDLLLTYYIDDYEWHAISPDPVDPGEEIPSDPGIPHDDGDGIITPDIVIKSPEEAYSLIFNYSKDLTEFYQTLNMYGDFGKPMQGEGFSCYEIVLEKGKFVAVEDYRSKTFIVYYHKLATAARSNFSISRDYSAGNSKKYLKKGLPSTATSERFSKTVGKKMDPAPVDYAQFYTNGKLDQEKINQWVFGNQDDQSDLLDNAQQIFCADSTGAGTPVFDLSKLPKILEIIYKQTYHDPTAAEIEQFNLHGKDPNTTYCEIRNSRSDMLFYFNYIKKGDVYALVTAKGIAYISSTDYNLLKLYCPVKYPI